MIELINVFESPLNLFKEQKTKRFKKSHDVVRTELMYGGLFNASDSSVDHVQQCRIGVVFSGGPAPGGHDVISGILSYLRSGDELIGFMGGPGGLLSGEHKFISTDDMDLIEGVGGFDFLGTDRTKISSPDQFSKVKAVIERLQLSSLIIIGGDDSNTNALYLADALYGICNVIGIPKTIDGDLQYHPYLPISFGFHTATQHYSALVQQLKIDALATKKYWHLIKLMGRSASHVTLEVALQTHPHACVLTEEIMDLRWSLRDLLDYFVTVILDRLKLNKPFGVIVFPEGILDAFSEFKALMQGQFEPINNLLAGMGVQPLQLTHVDEDEHGNKNVSTFNTEKILMDLIMANLRQHGSAAAGLKMVPHFFGYTGRAVEPTSFDSAYSLLLGKTAYELSLSNVSGVMVGCDFSKDIPQPFGIPLHAMVDFDSEKSRYVIQKEMVSLEASDFKLYKTSKPSWVSLDVSIPRPALFEAPKRIEMDYLKKGQDV